MLILKKIQSGVYENKVNDIKIEVSKNEINGWSGAILKEKGLLKDVFCGGYVMNYETLIETESSTKKEVCIYLGNWIKNNL